MDTESINFEIFHGFCAMFLFRIICCMCLLPTLVNAQPPRFLRTASLAYARHDFHSAYFLSAKALDLHPENEKALGIHLWSGLRIMQDGDSLFTARASAISSLAGESVDVKLVFLLNHLEHERFDVLKTKMAGLDLQNGDERLIYSVLNTRMGYLEKDPEKMLESFCIYLIADPQGKYWDFMVGMLKRYESENGPRSLSGHAVLKNNKSGVYLLTRSLLETDPQKAAALAILACETEWEQHAQHTPMVLRYALYYMYRNGLDKYLNFKTLKHYKNIEFLFLFPDSRLMAMSLAAEQKSMLSDFEELQSLGMGLFEPGFQFWDDDWDFSLFRFMDTCEIARILAQYQSAAIESVWDEFEPLSALYLIPKSCGKDHKTKEFLMHSAMARLISTINNAQINDNLFTAWSYFAVYQHFSAFANAPAYRKEKEREVLAMNLEKACAAISSTDVKARIEECFASGRLYAGLLLLQVSEPYFLKSGRMETAEQVSALRQTIEELVHLREKPGYAFGLDEHALLESAMEQATDQAEWEVYAKLIQFYE